jgi:hypothetical protein
LLRENERKQAKNENECTKPVGHFSKRGHNASPWQMLARSRS